MECFVIVNSQIDREQERERERERERMLARTGSAAVLRCFEPLNHNNDPQPFEREQGRCGWPWPLPTLSLQGELNTCRMLHIPLHTHPHTLTHTHTEGHTNTHTHTHTHTLSHSLTQSHSPRSLNLVWNVYELHIYSTATFPFALNLYKRNRIILSTFKIPHIPHIFQGKQLS